MLICLSVCSFVRLSPLPCDGSHRGCSVCFLRREKKKPLHAWNVWLRRGLTCDVHRRHACLCFLCLFAGRRTRNLKHAAQRHSPHPFVRPLVTTSLHKRAQTPHKTCYYWSAQFAFEIECTVWVKNVTPPLEVSRIFSQRLIIFKQNFTHAYCVFISTPNYKILFNYL